jgi:hypothetical protein
MEPIVIFLLILVFVVAALMIRVEAALRFRRRLFDRIFEQNEKDFRAGDFRYFAYRYRAFRTVSFNATVWRFWKPLTEAAFYPDNVLKLDDREDYMRRAL